jgi:putative ABC transport system permease protein
MINDLRHDIRYAFRTIARAPGFAAAAIVALALGIGANTAIFSLVRAVFLRDLPFRDADRLAFVWTIGPNQPRTPLTPGRFLDFRKGARSFASLAGISQLSYTLTGSGLPERLSADSVSANFFETLGSTAAIGRTFTPADAGSRVAVLSHALWMRRFGGDRALVGRALTLNDVPYTVLGVMPPTFVWPVVNAQASNGPPPEMWLCAVDHDVPAMHIETADLSTNRRFGYLRAVGRLAPGATREQAEAELATIAEQIGRRYPESDGGRTASVVPLRTQFLGDVRRPIAILAGAVAFVLAIACANVASLLLGRATTRRRELAVRVALGAGRGRLFRQLVTEAVVLSIAAAAVGTLLAWWSTSALVALSPMRVLRLEETRIDGAVLAFTVLLSIVTGIAFGVIPAFQASRSTSSDALKQGAARLGGPAGGRVREGLAVVQVAIALVLLVGAGLLLKSFLRLQHTDTGIDTRNLLTFDIALTGERAEYQRLQTAFYDDMLRRLRALPGVTAAGAAVTLPIGGDDFGAPVFIEGRPAPAPGHEPGAGFQIVSAGYFETMGMRVIAGRDFAGSDTRDRPLVVVVNRTFARTHWPGEDAIGRRISTDSAGPWMTVVGVVSDIRHLGPATPPRPEFYQPYTQNSLSFMAVVVRTAVDPLSIVGAVRHEILAIDPALPIAGVNTMDAHLHQAVSEPRFMSAVVTAFAGVALALSLLGIYATLAFAVAQRTREIGIRVALGARPSEVMALVLRRGLIVAAAGVSIGLVVSLAFTRVLARLLFDVQPTDASTYVLVTGVFAAVALGASAVPAFRAARVDPIQTLRAD